LVYKRLSNQDGGDNSLKLRYEPYIFLSIAPQKIDIDNNARFRYQVGYWFGLIGTSIYGAEADTQFSIFDLTALK
jgi:hypothetical protein